MFYSDKSQDIYMIVYICLVFFNVIFDVDVI